MGVHNKVIKERFFSKMSERYNLAWNEFEKYTNLAFRSLLSDTEFTDVTLACDDEKQVTAHKVVLSACSPFFRKILVRNPHQKPLLYLRGLKHEDLEAILKFMYNGQTEVSQDNLENFLKVAKDLEVKGLNESSTASRSTDLPIENIKQNGWNYIQPRVDEVWKAESPYRAVEQNTPALYPQETSDWDDSSMGDFESYEEGNLQEYPADIQDDVSYFQNIDGKFPCGQCNYQAGTKTLLRRHQQNIHQGVKFPCDRCDRKFSSADALRVHIYQHEGKTFPCAVCDTVFLTPSQLSTHKSKNHKH